MGHAAGRRHLSDPFILGVSDDGRRVVFSEPYQLRVTANWWTSGKEHRLDNGAQYQVAGFERDGTIRLANGWFMAADYGHFRA